MSVKEKYRGLKPLPPDIRQRLKALPSLLKRHLVRLCYLFGSAVRNLRVSEDIDLAILPHKDFSYPAFYADISTSLRTDRLDIADLNIASPILQFEVVTTGKCLFSHSRKERYIFESSARMKYRDYLILLAQRKKF